jgi:ATP-dependent exoDNAse (exonuclease V) alpha subunit
LEPQLGAFTVPPEAEFSWERRIGLAQASLRQAESWAGVHRELEAIGFAVEKTGRGGRVLDVETARHVPLGRVATSMARLEERLGNYELAPAVAARDAREAQRREAGIAERVERLRAQPELVLDRLAETRSVWSGADIEREVRSALGVRAGHDAQIATATRAVAGASLTIDDDAYTIKRVVSEERAVFAAAATLADRKRTVELREPDAGLDAQQRAAYARLAGTSDLAIVTGIAGAGKSRLQRDVAAAYSAAGFRVIGTAVAGDAARTLGEEAAIDTRTVARLLVDLQNDRDRFDGRTVLMIDEAGTLGAAQARELLERARDAGARVMLLGDTSQHESVGRGSVLRGLAEEHGALDLLKTRRANEKWLREVATDLRAGVVSRALDMLRENGAVREHRTHDEARVTLVRSWAEATRAGKSALLVASRNDDVRAMNELAREAVSERIGEERVYATDFGERSFGIGDVLVGRERAHGGVNGDLYTLAGHRDDGRLELVRLRDEKRVVWDLHEHRAIDHGYATTSYRSQGRTVDSVFALASAAEARRGLYVDVTRAREDVTIAYGKDEVQDFGELLARAQRDNGKVLVRDVVRNVDMRIERKERKRLRSLAFEHEQEKTRKVDLRQEPKIDRGFGRGGFGR